MTSFFLNKRSYLTKCHCNSLSLIFVSYESLIIDSGGLRIYLFHQDEQQQAEILKREKEEILAKLSQAERTFGEGKSRVNKLEEDNAKLRRALEQSMTRINRMSVDSDYFVDRLASLVLN